jgi:hypothetical protein
MVMRSALAIMCPYKSIGFGKFSPGGGAGGSPQQPRLS